MKQCRRLITLFLFTTAAFCAPVVAAEPASQEVILGVITPLTGDGATYGRSTTQGVDLAIEAWNATHALKIKTSVEDDRMSPEEGVAAYQRQVAAASRPSAILGPFGSSVVLAVARVANEAKVSIITASATADAIAEAGPNVFRIVPTNRTQGRDDARFALDVLHAKTAAVLFQTNDYGQSLKDSFVAEFTVGGGRVVLEEGARNATTDFRTQVSKIKAANPDVIFFPIQSQEGTVFLRQLRDRGVKTPCISGDGAMTTELLKGAGKAAEGAYFSSLALGYGVTDEQIHTFEAAFRVKYGKDPDVYAAYYYEAAQIVASAIEAAGRDPEKVTEYLASMSGLRAFTGITGVTAFDARGEVDKRFYVYQAKAGKFVRVKQ